MRSALTPHSSCISWFPSVWLVSIHLLNHRGFWRPPMFSFVCNVKGGLTSHLGLHFTLVPSHSLWGPAGILTSNFPPTTTSTSHMCARTRTHTARMFQLEIIFQTDRAFPLYFAILLNMSLGCSCLTTQVAFLKVHLALKIYSTLTNIHILAC